MDSPQFKTASILESGELDRQNLERPTKYSSSTCTLVRRRRRWVPVQQCTLKNSLLVGVGYLELANAGDFAANVWNDVPIPIYAVILMAVGGTVALSMSSFAVKDLLLSWRNLQLLRQERHLLQTQHAATSEKSEGFDVHAASQLDVNFREMGTELVDRVAMDLCMGFGAILVGVGTFMAIGGANHDVWIASNLLSGYIGNSPAAVYGLANAIWSTYVFARADHHGVVFAKELDEEIVKRQLRPRLHSIKLHAIINGLTGVIAGVASLITATKWQGYVVLAPCIVSSIWCNYFWRQAIGYERAFCPRSAKLTKASLLEELQSATLARLVLEEGNASSSSSSTSETPADPLGRLLPNPNELASILEFTVVNNLFEDLCIDLLQNKQLSAALFNAPSHKTVTITSEELLASDPSYVESIVDVARACILRVGPRRFLYRERALIELLGCYLSRTSPRS